MRQLYLPARIGAGGQEVELRGADYRHIARVLRLREGAELDAVDEAGRPCRARILRLGRESLTLEVWPAPPEAPAARSPRLGLYQCLPKGQKMDIIVRQATEAGVETIVPVRSARSVPEAGAGRIDRWRRIGVEALKQCGRRTAPTILPIAEIGALVGPGPQGRRSAADIRRVFFHEQPSGSEPLHLVLREPASEIELLVGPEGGLAADEVRLLREAGWSQAYLGPNVLRVETAALAAVGAVLIIVLEREAWKAVPP